MSKNNDLNTALCLVNPDTNELKALARLSDNRDFVIFYEYLERCLREQDKKNRVAVGDVALRQGQGVSQCLETEMSLILDAKTALRRSVPSA